MSDSNRADQGTADRLSETANSGERKFAGQGEASGASRHAAGPTDMTGRRDGAPALPDEPVKYLAVTPDDVVVPPHGWQVSTPKRNERLVGATLAAVDAVAIMIAFLFSLGVRHDTWSWAPAVVLAALLPAWILSVKAAGLYDKDSDVLGHSTI